MCFDHQAGRQGGRDPDPEKRHYQNIYIDTYIALKVDDECGISKSYETKWDQGGNSNIDK